MSWASVFFMLGLACVAGILRPRWGFVAVLIVAFAAFGGRPWDSPLRHAPGASLVCADWRTP
jgi:hypothetical protein